MQRTNSLTNSNFSESTDIIKFFTSAFVSQHYRNRSQKIRGYVLRGKSYPEHIAGLVKQFDYTGCPNILAFASQFQTSSTCLTERKKLAQFQQLDWI